MSTLAGLAQQSSGLIGVDDDAWACEARTSHCAWSVEEYRSSLPVSSPSFRNLRCGVAQQPHPTCFGRQSCVFSESYGCLDQVTSPSSVDTNMNVQVSLSPSHFPHTLSLFPHTERRDFLIIRQVACRNGSYHGVLFHPIFILEGKQKGGNSSI